MSNLIKLYLRGGQFVLWSKRQVFLKSVLIYFLQ